MGYFSNDLLSLLKTFITETSGQIDQIEQVLQEADKNQQYSWEQIDTIFRIFHTIKGSCAIMELNYISDLAHKLEDIFSFHQKNATLVYDNFQVLRELLYDSIDFIRSELTIITNDNYYPSDVSSLIFRADSFLQKQSVDMTEEVLNLGSFLNSKKPGYYVQIQFHHICNMEHLRALSMIKKLTNFCIELESFPKSLVSDPTVLKYLKKTGFFIRVLTDTPEKIMDELQQYPSIEKFKILQYIKPPQKPDHSNIYDLKTVMNSHFTVSVQKIEHLQNLINDLGIAIKQQPYPVTRIYNEVEQAVLSLRMVPIRTLIPLWNRLIRNICKDQQKHVKLNLVGTDIEIDKNIVDCLNEPILHMIRNAVDHGIESPEDRIACNKPEYGTISITLQSKEEDISITVSDDGRGFNTSEILKVAKQKGLLTKPENQYTDEELFLFTQNPGFTTKNGITQYSGRGMGLNVVQETLKNFGGYFNIYSQTGLGSSFTLHFPPSIQLINCLHFSFDSILFALPCYQVIYFSHYSSKNQTSLLYKDQQVEIKRLSDLFHLTQNNAQSQDLLLCVKHSDGMTAYLVDDIVGIKKSTLKPLPALCSEHMLSKGIQAWTQIDSGNICFVLDSEKLDNAYKKLKLED